MRGLTELCLTVFSVPMKRLNLLITKLSSFSDGESLFTALSFTDYGKLYIFQFISLKIFLCFLY